MENEKEMNVKGTEPAKENSAHDKKAEKKERIPMRVRVANWLLEDHPKLKLGARIAAGVTGAAALIGGTFLATKLGLGSGVVTDALPEPADILNAVDPATVSEVVETAAETITEAVA